MYLDGFYLQRCSQGARCNMNQLRDVLHCQVWHWQWLHVYSHSHHTNSSPRILTLLTNRHTTRHLVLSPATSLKNLLHSSLWYTNLHHEDSGNRFTQNSTHLPNTGPEFYMQNLPSPFILFQKSQVYYSHRSNTTTIVHNKLSEPISHSPVAKSEDSILPITKLSMWRCLKPAKSTFHPHNKFP